MPRIKTSSYLPRMQKKTYRCLGHNAADYSRCKRRLAGFKEKHTWCSKHLKRAADHDVFGWFAPGQELYVQWVRKGTMIFVMTTRFEILALATRAHFAVDSPTRTTPFVLSGMEIALEDAAQLSTWYNALDISPAAKTFLYDVSV